MLKALSFCILASAQAATESNTASLVALVKKEADPTKLAARLVEAHNAQTGAMLYDKCQKLSGYEHCTKCALPLRDSLVNQLINVKHELWSERNKLNKKATTVCTAKAPFYRRGKHEKCCAKVGSAGTYLPNGFKSCPKESTFDAVVFRGYTEKPLKTQVKYNTREYKWVGPHHSTMISDCCEYESACFKNEKHYTEEVKATGNMLVIRSQQIVAYKDRIAAMKRRISDAKMQVSSLMSKIDKICLHKKAESSDEYSEGQNRYTLTYSKVKACKSGTIVDSLNAQKKNIVKAKVHLRAMREAIKVVKMVKKWLAPKGDTTAFRSRTNEHKAPPADFMVNLLEKAKTSDSLTNAVLSEAIELVESGSKQNWVGRGKVLQLFKQLIKKLQEGESKHKKFIAQIKNTGKRQRKYMFRQIEDLLEEMRQQDRHISTMELQRASLETSIVTARKQINGYVDNYAALWTLREVNVEKCTNYQSYFDAEAVARTDELLVLKKAMDLIKHIQCGATPAPTPDVCHASSCESMPYWSVCRYPKCVDEKGDVSYFINKPIGEQGFKPEKVNYLKGLGITDSSTIRPECCVKKERCEQTGNTIKNTACSKAQEKAGACTREIKMCKVRPSNKPCGNTDSEYHQNLFDTRAKFLAGRRLKSVQKRVCNEYYGWQFGKVILTKPATFHGCKGDLKANKDKYPKQWKTYSKKCDKMPADKKCLAKCGKKPSGYGKDQARLMKKYFQCRKNCATTVRKCETEIPMCPPCHGYGCMTPRPTPKPGCPKGSGCASGTYQFKNYVFKNEKKFNVPMYMKGQTFSIPKTDVGACRKIDTVHDSVWAGKIIRQKICHFFHCCCNAGAPTYYGSIGIGKEAAKKNLCKRDYCGMFKPNMKLIDAHPLAESELKHNQANDKPGKGDAKPWDIKKAIHFTKSS